MSGRDLSAYFCGVAFKRLSAVEASQSASNQHEFNGSAVLRRLLGDAQPRQIPTHFLWLDDEEPAASADGMLTWYDARARHPTRTEYRLYFKDNVAIGRARPGDTMVIAIRPDGSSILVVAAAGSTAENQLLLLFGAEQPTLSFEGRQFRAGSAEVDFVRSLILETLGIEAPLVPKIAPEELIAEFGLSFPPTRHFSDFARRTAPQVDAREAPDEALMNWIEHEEALFRALERKVVEERLRTGFMADESADVDGFLQFSLSVQNRRKSRAGAALENHLQALFENFELKFETQAPTENGNKPDFLFPSGRAYQDPNFTAELLTVLGSKSTCKDRWRQVLSEAQRVNPKFLLTLEAAISENQTSEMQAKQLQLVIPRPLHATYRERQRAWLFDVASFIRYVEDQQKALAA